MPPIAASAIPSITNEEEQLLTKPEVEPRAIPIKVKPFDETETSSLLPHADESEEKTGGLIDSHWDELLAQLKISVPLMLTFLVGSATGFTDTLFLGHLEHQNVHAADALAAAGQAGAWTNVMASICLAFPNAINILASQASGRNEPEVARLWLHRGCLLSLIAAIPCSVGCCYAGTFSDALGASDTVVELSGIYGKIMALCIPSWILYWVVCDYIQATEQDTTPNLIATSIVVLGNIPANQIFIYEFDMGFAGSPSATAFSGWAGLIACCVYVRLRMPDVWTRMTSGFNWRQVCNPTGFLDYLMVAVPNSLLFAVNNAIMIVLILIATSMKHPERSVGGIAVVQQTAMPMLSLWWGVSNAVGTRVGIGVGKGSYTLCIHAIRVGLFQLVIVTAPIVALYICWAHGFASMVTNSHEIIELCAGTFPLVATGLIATNLQELLGSVISAAGENLKLTILQCIYAAAFCGFALLFTSRKYYDLQMPGLLYAWNAATCLLLLMEIPIVMFLDWDAMFKLAAERNQMSPGDKEARSLDAPAAEEEPLESA